MEIPEWQKERFQLLGEAFEREQVCLVRCWEKQTGEPAFLVCVVLKEEDGICTLYPLARLLDRCNVEQEYQPPIFDD